MNLKATLIGGNRYTPIDLESSISAGETVLHLDQIYNAKLDDVFLMNFALTYRVIRKKQLTSLKLISKM